MTDSPPPLDISATFLRIQAQQAERLRFAEDPLPANKAGLFGALAATGIDKLIVTFDGAGDSGQIESTDAYRGEAVVPLPEAAITIVSPRWDVSGLDEHTLPVAEAVEALVYDLLEAQHPGWEINEGSSGTFTFDVADEAVRLDYCLRTTDWSSDEW